MSDDLSMPWSAPDVAKAIRETLAAARGGAKLFQYTADLYNYRKARKAAERLGSLAFVPNGMKGPLARIACGEGSAEDIKALSQMFAGTAGEVEKSTERLRDYRRRFREDRGLAATLTAYDEVLWGKVGKEGIRDLISDLIHAAGASPVDTKRVQEIAVRAVALIETFNQQLSNLHDLVLPPKKKAAVPRKRSK
jgi:hypothetical protein